MTLSPSLAAALNAAHLDWQADVALAKRTFWRVGGPADALIQVRSLAELVTVQQVATAHDTPVHVLGNGSNLLVADAGIRGCVLQLTGELAHTQAHGDRLVAGAGLKLVVLLARAVRHHWAGLHPLVGIPGTVGGAVRMNAGTSLGEISDLLESVTLVHPNGTVAQVPAAQLDLAYRTCTLPEGAVIADATLSLHGSWQDSAEISRTFLERRKATQPLDLPSCGSTFTNPPGDAAGRLVEAAGLKGFAIGGAMVSPKHANFVVNTGGATASDIRAVIDHMRATVHAAFDVVLEPEVQLAGTWSPWALLS